MPRQSPIIKLRNAMSTALMEHKEHMEQGTFKILYETLGKETADAPSKHWVKLTYAKASLDYSDHTIVPELRICQRNIELTSAKIDTITAAMHERHASHCTLHNICSTHDYKDAEHVWFAQELDEPDLWDCESAVFRIIRLDVIGA